MNYEQWEEKQEISSLSPEGYYSELAWNAAIEEAKKIIQATSTAENNTCDLVVLQLEELEFLKSD